MRSLTILLVVLLGGCAELRDDALPPEAGTGTVTWSGDLAEGGLPEMTALWNERDYFTEGVPERVIYFIEGGTCAALAEKRLAIRASSEQYDLDGDSDAFQQRNRESFAAYAPSSQFWDGAWLLTSAVTGSGPITPEQWGTDTVTSSIRIHRFTEREDIPGAYLGGERYEGYGSATLSPPNGIVGELSGWDGPTLSGWAEVNVLWQLPGEAPEARRDIRIDFTADECVF